MCIVQPSMRFEKNILSSFLNKLLLTNPIPISGFSTEHFLMDLNQKSTGSLIEGLTMTRIDQLVKLEGLNRYAYNIVHHTHRIFG